MKIVPATLISKIVMLSLVLILLLFIIFYSSTLIVDAEKRIMKNSLRKIAEDIAGYLAENINELEKLGIEECTLEVKFKTPSLGKPYSISLINVTSKNKLAIKIDCQQCGIRDLEATLPPLGSNVVVTNSTVYGGVEVALKITYSNGYYNVTLEYMSPGG